MAVKAGQKRKFHIIVFFLLILQISGLNIKRSNVGCLKPPIDTVERNRKGGGEYGIRQLSASESISTLQSWQKKLGIIKGDVQIETYELLETLGKIVQVMPGKMPQRFEYVLFGDFVDGTIECICGCYTTKVTCPWEMDIILIAQCPTFSDEKTGNMVDFITASCLLNACLPNFSPLIPYSSTVRIDKFVKVEFKEDHDELAEAYQNANKGACRLLCLDSIPEVYTFPYWYSINVKRPGTEVLIPLYLRQTMNSLVDFEMTFTYPLTGTGSGRGTVGGALVLVEGQKLNPEASSEYFEALRREVAKKIIHPDLLHRKFH